MTKAEKQKKQFQKHFEKCMTRLTKAAKKAKKNAD